MDTKKDTHSVKRRPKAVVQDSAPNQRLLDTAANGDAREGIRQGLAEAMEGQGIDAEVFFAEFEAKHGIQA
ncbi:MAG: Antitoxin [Bryobacterales bacterium]|nr:Antitoxin [Bryobacterales bacterium]